MEGNDDSHRPHPYVSTPSLDTFAWMAIVLGTIAAAVVGAVSFYAGMATAAGVLLEAFQ